MELFKTLKENKFNLLFNELESENLNKIHNGKVSIRNKLLCSFIENHIHSNYEECNGKRVMVANIENRPYNVEAILLFQNVDVAYKEPKQEFNFGKITEICFNDIKNFEEYMSNKNYNYIITNFQIGGKIKAIVFNMTQRDEMLIAYNSGKIEEINSIGGYIFYKLYQKMYNALNKAQ